MSNVPNVAITYIFNGDTSATNLVSAAQLDTQLGDLAASDNQIIAALDRITDSNNSLAPQTVGYSQLKAEVRGNLLPAQGGTLVTTAKIACRLVATANVGSLNGNISIDGATTVAGDRILLVAQTTASQNGIWAASAGAWARATDLLAGTTQGDGWYTVIYAGSANAGTAWAVTSVGTTIVGTGNMSFVQLAATSYANIDQVVSTIADLKLAAPPAYPVVYSVQGYYAAGDGGGGTFRWNSGDASADNGGTIIQLNIGGNGRWNRIYIGDIPVEWFGARGDGVTADTVQIVNAATAAASAGAKIIFGSRTYLTAPISFPTTLPGVVGEGKYKSVIKLVRQAYSGGQIMLSFAANTGGIILRDFTVDIDSVEFRTALVYGLVMNGSHYAKIDNVRVIGRGDTAVFTNSMIGGRITDLTVDATGTAANSFTSCFQGQNCLDVVVSRMRTTGLPAYSGVFGIGTFWSKFVTCHTDGTSGAFGYSLGGCTYSHITDCTARNTSHEAFQITDCYYCTIQNNTAEWDNGFGVDAGISLNGQTAASCRLNKVLGNTIINSYSVGLLCANNSQLNELRNNTMRDCGVRGYAIAPVASAAVMGQYTALAAAACGGNTFAHNKIATESGPVLNGFFEANNGGGGSTIASTILLENEWQGGGAITTRYVLADATTSQIHELDWTSWVPTVASTGGTITSYVATSAEYMRRGKWITVRFDITITNAGTGSGSINVSLPLTAATRSGTLSGRDIDVSQAAIHALCSGANATVVKYDGTYPAGTARLTMSGTYKAA